MYWRYWRLLALVSVVAVLALVFRSSHDGRPSARSAADLGASLLFRRQLRLDDNPRPFQEPWLSNMPALPASHGPDSPRWNNSVAVCSVMKDENITDVREWLEYYRWLGVDRVFLIDNDSRDGPAMLEQLASEFDESYLTLRRELMPRAQMKAYAWCAEEQRANYNWLIFADLDEFLALRSQQPLKKFLNQYKHEAGLAVHWIWVGPNGRATRPTTGGVLPYYTLCDAHAATQIKTIANTFFLRGLAIHPHNFVYRDDRLAVDEARRPIYLSWRMSTTMRNAGYKDADCRRDTSKCFQAPGATGVPASADKIALYHFATKSLEDFAVKMARGSSMSRRTRKKMSYFAEVSRKQTHAEWCKVPSDAAAQCCSHLYQPGGNPDLLNATRTLLPGSSSIPSQIMRAQERAKRKAADTKDPELAQSHPKASRRLASAARSNAEPSAQ